MDTALLSALDQVGQKKFEHAIAALQGDDGHYGNLEYHDLNMVAALS